MNGVPMLPLRDVQAGTPPPWWPPAPGWLWLGAAVLAVAVAVAIWSVRRRRKAARWRRYFDQVVAEAGTPAERLAAISALLRRAARRLDPQADRLQGEAWLHLLDQGLSPPAFAAGPGRLLIDDLYRPQVDPAALAALHALARRRFVQWMVRS